jgi:AraC-like DNA-binding protein
MALRGTNKLGELFVHQQEPEKRKGRSLKLILQRNECLTDRYFFYSHIGEKRYDLILEKLSTDFFLSESTIADLLNDNYNKLITVKKTYQESSDMSIRKKLQNKWSHLSWNQF